MPGSGGGGPAAVTILAGARRSGPGRGAGASLEGRGRGESVLVAGLVVDRPVAIVKDRLPHHGGLGAMLHGLLLLDGPNVVVLEGGPQLVFRRTLRPLAGRSRDPMEVLQPVGVGQVLGQD